MPLRFKANARNGDFKSVPPGSHIAVCNLLVDLGLQPPSDPHDEPRHQVYIRFEVPGERVEYMRDGQKYDDPLTIGSTYTATMNQKGNLRKHLEGWRGKQFTDEEAERFDISSILGKACMLTVVENVKGTKVYSNIAGISGLPQGVSAPQAETKLLLYYADHTADFNLLPEWLQKKIDSQISEPETVNVGDPTEITNDDIPF